MVPLTLLAQRACQPKLLEQLRSEAAEILKLLESGVKVEPGIITCELSVREDGGRKVIEVLLDGQPVT